MRLSHFLIHYYFLKILMVFIPRSKQPSCSSIIYKVSSNDILSSKHLYFDATCFSVLFSEQLAIVKNIMIKIMLFIQIFLITFLSNNLCELETLHFRNSTNKAKFLMDICKVKIKFFPKGQILQMPKPNASI